MLYILLNLKDGERLSRQKEDSQIVTERTVEAERKPVSWRTGRVQGSSQRQYGMGSVNGFKIKWMIELKGK